MGTIERQLQQNLNKVELYGSPIPVVEESKFLGIIFDRKLCFIPHITRGDQKVRGK